ncbi:hypothetical protein [Actinomadura sediminis]|uniref:DUF3592 domain-containing protein n=1 Tax=Actinomadura sediminis TaxID=1038904 RepID=A0ABW3ET42_9ACTN
MANGIAGGRTGRWLLAVALCALFPLTAWQAVEAWRAAQAHEDWRKSRVCSAAVVPECRASVPAQVVEREEEVRARFVYHWLRLRETSPAAAATGSGDRTGGGAARTYRVRVLDDDAWAGAEPGERAELVRWRGEIRQVRLDPGGPWPETLPTSRHPSWLPVRPTGIALALGGFGTTLAWLAVTYGRRNADGTLGGTTPRGEAKWSPLVPATSLFIGTCFVGTGAAVAGRTSEWQPPTAARTLLYAAVAVAACVPLVTPLWLWQRGGVRKAHTAPLTPPTERAVRAVVWGHDDFRRPDYDGLLIGPRGIVASCPAPDVRVALHPLPRPLVLDRIRGPLHHDPAWFELVADCRTPDGRPLHIGAGHEAMRWIHGALQAAAGPGR